MVKSNSGCDATFSAPEQCSFASKHIVFSFWASLVAQLVKNLSAMREIVGLGRSPGEGKGYPLQYSGLENSMECIVHGVTESDMNEQLTLPFGTWQFTAVSQKVLFYLFGSSHPCWVCSELVISKNHFYLSMCIYFYPGLCVLSVSCWLCFLPYWVLFIIAP